MQGRWSLSERAGGPALRMGWGRDDGVAGPA